MAVNPRYRLWVRLSVVQLEEARMEVTVFSPRDREPNDEQVLTFWQLVFSPDRLRWSPDDSQDLASWDDQRVLQWVALQGRVH